jgi:hypothetical protein
MIFWRDIKDFILSYKYSKNQYFLVSFPKTGRTWLMHMINQIKKQSNCKLKREKYFIFNEHDNSEIIIEDGTRNDPLDVFKFTSRFRYRRGNVIFLVRDPRDVIVSHFHQVTKRSRTPFVFNSISEFLKDDILGFKRIIHFYNLWQSNKDIPEGFLLVSYENLINNGIEELQRIIDFLAINISKDSLIKIYEESSASKMREKEINDQLEDFNNFGKSRNQLKVRNAKIGGYKSELSEQDIFYCNNEMKKLNTYFGY